MAEGLREGQGVLEMAVWVLRFSRGGEMARSWSGAGRFFPGGDGRGALGETIILRVGGTALSYKSAVGVMQLLGELTGWSAIAVRMRSRAETRRKERKHVTKSWLF